LRQHCFKFFFLFALICGGALSSQITCGLNPQSFCSGESLHYKVVYDWGPIWLESAEVNFTVKSANYNGKGCYLFNGSGSTYPKHDWFFKVRDVFETYVDSQSFRPLKFSANILEGRKKDEHTYLFNNPLKKAYTLIRYGAKPLKVDTIKTNTCTIDVLTAIYFARSIDYSNHKKNDTISISLLLDGKVYAIYVRYLGKTIYTSKELGTYRCIKFSPLLIEGTIFKKGEGMTVWVSDDKNKLPLYIETPITVGKVKVRLIKYKGLKNPENAKTEPALKN
jgi:hypothetical protein